MSRMVHITFTAEEFDTATGLKEAVIAHEFEVPDSATHDEITERYCNFLRAMGYVINGELVYVRQP
jgi:hypothetical protein